LTALLPAPEPGVEPLSTLPSLLADDPGELAIGGGADVIAVPEAARALFVAALAARSARSTILVAVPTAAEAEQLAPDLARLLGPAAVELFPAWETLPFERVSPALETMGRRQRVMWRLRVGGEQAPKVVVAPVRALTQRLGPHIEAVEPIRIAVGDVIDRDALLAQLVSFGYRREYQVESRGEFAVRGSIVDVYPTTDDHPVRIDLWGDEVDHLSAFGVADQRSTHELAALRIFPARELLPTAEVQARARELLQTAPWNREQWDRIAEGQTFDGMESWLPWLAPAEHVISDLLADDALVLLVEPRRLRDRSQELIDDEAALAGALAQTWDAPTGETFPQLSLGIDHVLAQTKARAVSVLASPESPSTPYLAATRFDPVQGDAAGFAARLRALQADGYALTIAANGRGSAVRLRDVLAGDGMALPIAGAAASASGTAVIVVAPLSRGVMLQGARIAVIGEADLTGRRRVHRPPRKRGAQRGADYFEDLEPGNFVVHEHHGVGRYEGMVTRAIGGVERDYLLIAYKGADKLYVPTEQVATVRRYTGGETPTLNRMGGADFQKQRAKVRRAVQEIAQELVVLYRRRLASPGFAFNPDSPWQHEMEDSFPFEETPDQLAAIDATKADMERPVPMDRLICGDVGYGKTEVAVRAAFKAVQDGKQVAVLVPTTLLASQHGETFRERFANYPVRVEVMSRFLSAKDQRAVARDVESGGVDVVIGTHRLLSGDVKFKDLGLLIIDEEQRFGVGHKERMKELRAHVDVLTLTATPIPRTLEMSLTGIRDMSLINTPPEDRQPILTYVGEYIDNAVAEAVRRELLREGQVFYVHNRVGDIEFIAEHVRNLVPEARVAIAHGQMDESRLERVVLDFADREYDVLVCTTIVESGLDMPSVNTLVVDRADLLGLAQLYQLRGRVGRRGQRAYAYLLHPVDRALTEEAYERLKTIGEFTDLGSGFKIAMRDLEIRGAGNLLGGQQSGHIAAVGFDLYCEMVTEAVGELMGEERVIPADVSIDLPVDAHLPREYVERDDTRIEAYRRLANVRSTADVEDIAREWRDRYGEPPPAAAALLAVAKLRAECLRVGAREVSLQRGIARIGGISLKESQKVRLRRLAPKSILKETDEFTVPVVSAEPADAIRELLEALIDAPEVTAEAVSKGPSGDRA
jgi:transcription-repair coupling factor (superfamily II helicase)